MAREERSDAELIRAAASDPASFRELYERHAERVFAFFVNRTRDEHTAEDLTAETFARAWMGRRRFRDWRQGSAGPWLFGIARHVLLTSVERARLEASACERLGIFEQLDRAPAGTVPDWSWTEGLEDALDVLSEAQRQAVRLRVFHDLSYRQIAERLHCSPVAARIRVSRGLAALRDRSPIVQEVWE